MSFADSPDANTSNELDPIGIAMSLSSSSSAEGPGSPEWSMIVTG
jgi:hypothetical protein